MVMFAENLKSTVWIAPCSVTNGVQRFGTPVSVRVHCRELSSYTDILSYGPDYIHYRRLVAANSLLGSTNDFDRVWIEATPSDPTDVLAADATHFVQRVIVGAGGVTEVIVRKRHSDA